MRRDVILNQFEFDLIHSGFYRKDIPPLSFKFRRKKVVIKPNVLRGATPDVGVTTHPLVLKAVINEVVKHHPSSLIVGDNSGVFSYGMNEQAFKVTGLMDAAGQYYRNLSLDTVQ